MFGVYMLAMSFCGFFSTFCVIFFILRRQKKLLNEVTIEHWQDMGKLLFGLGIVFHAYIGFSQYMLIWYANIPIETGWFLPRQLGAWKWVSLLLILGHFVLPFLLLVSRWPKRWKNMLAGIAVWMLLMMIVDVYWLVMPAMSPQVVHDATSLQELVDGVDAGTISVGWNLTVTNFTALAGMIGLLIAGTCIGLRRCSLIPSSDPRLDEALAFENM